MSSPSPAPSGAPEGGAGDVSAGPEPVRTLTFVCCVEAGGLEDQTVRLVESLRRWGGRFAGCNIIAVTPRPGPPLSASTRAAFARLGVEHHRVLANLRHAWFKFLNKPHALVAAEPFVRTEQTCWIDSDILVVGEPAELLLKDGEGFVACASDRNLGTTGDDDYAPYWRHVAGLFGFALEDLPLVRSLEEQIDIRFYFNAGIFTYRSGSGYPRRYLEATLRILESGTSSRHTGLILADQIAFGLAALSMGLQFRALPLTHNYPVGSKLRSSFDPDKLRACRICHYHDALWPSFFDTFVGWLGDAHPDVAAWVRTQGPMRNPQPRHWKAVARAIKEWGDWRTKRIERASRPV